MLINDSIYLLDESLKYVKVGDAGARADVRMCRQAGRRTHV